MSPAAHLIVTLLLWAGGDRGDIIVNQSPNFLTAAPGSTVSISCKTETAIDDDMALYHQVPGQAPKSLIYDVSTRHSGVSDRFSGSGYDHDFTFKISNVQPEDAGVYYCQQYEAYPLTQRYRAIQKPLFGAP
ncbi:KV401 protein, partial [Polypterus senegalus]